MSMSSHTLLNENVSHVAEWQTKWHNPPDLGLVSSVATCLLQNLQWCIIAIQYCVTCTMGRHTALLKIKWRHVFLKYSNKHLICRGSHSCSQTCQSYQNPLRFSKVMITNVLQPFYGSQCINCMSDYVDVRHVWTCWSTNCVTLRDTCVPLWYCNRLRCVNMLVVWFCVQNVESVETVEIWRVWTFGTLINKN